MADLQFNELQLDKYGDQTVTAVIGFHRSSSVRDLWDTLVRLALHVRDRPPVHAVCVATDSRLSNTRLAEEHGRLCSILQSDLAGRLHWMHIDEESGGVRTSLDVQDPTLASVLKTAIRRQSPPPRKFARLGARPLVVARLVEDRLQWPRPPARTITEWQKLCGVSYPTLASVVSELRQRGLVDQSKRQNGAAPKKHGVKLRALAPNEVMRLVGEFCVVRPVQLFVDPTGLVNPSRLMARLTRLQETGRISSEIRVGGVHAASHYYPQLDVTAAPRLDLSSPIQVDVAMLDAGLRLLPAGEPSSMAVLAVHLTHQSGLRPDPGAEQTHPWSTCFESLADLLELGFEREALEMAAALCKEHRSTTSPS